MLGIGGRVGDRRLRSQRLERGPHDHARRGRPIDGGGDPRVDWRDDLRRVLPVHLVAVVFGRVVARGDDHARRRAEALDREADEGRRHGLAEQQDPQIPRRAEDRRHVLGELAAHSARVAADDDPAL